MGGSTFEQSYLLGNTSNNSASEILQTYSFRIGLSEGRYSYATAMGMVQSVISVILYSQAMPLQRGYRAIACSNTTEVKIKLIEQISIKSKRKLKLTTEDIALDTIIAVSMLFVFLRRTLKDKKTRGCELPLKSLA